MHELTKYITHGTGTNTLYTDQQGHHYHRRRRRCHQKFHSVQNFHLLDDVGPFCVR